jgi:hypothetical protein
VLNGWLQTINDGPIQLKPTPTARLLTCWQELPNDEIAQRILDLHERGDKVGHWGVALEQLPEDSLDEVFGAGGLIEQINQFNPPESGSDEIDEYPPWSSGDLATDLLADLSYSLGDFNQAWCAINSMGIQAVSNYLKRFGDLRKGPEEREKEGLKTWFWEHKNKFDDGFYDDKSN